MPTENYFALYTRLNEIQAIDVKYFSTKAKRKEYENSHPLPL
jgi:hypothetical protein